MASAVRGTKWSTMADLDIGESHFGAQDEGYILRDNIGTGNAASMGHFCLYAQAAENDASYTQPFDFPILGDFTMVINATNHTFSAALQYDVSVQGSVDGTAWFDLKTDVIDGVAVSGAGADPVVLSKVYDIDANGKAPFMRLELTAAANHCAETFVIAIIPH